MSDEVEQVEQVDIVALRQQLDELPIDQKTKDKILSDTQKKIGEGAKNAVHAAFQGIVNHDELDEARNSLSGLSLKTITRFPTEEDGEVVIETSFTKAGTGTRKSSGGGGGQATRVQVDGITYPSSAAACRELGFEHEGRNAYAVLQGRLKKNEIEELLRGDEIPAEEDAIEESEGAEEEYEEE
jgi:hypothetical protein